MTDPADTPPSPQPLRLRRVGAPKPSVTEPAPTSAFGGWAAVQHDDGAAGSGRAPSPNRTLSEDVEPKMLYHSRLEVGDQIPGTNYRILEWLGEGAAGVVYRCEHVELERPAALKILRPDVAPDSRRAQLFRAEAKVASRSRSAGADGSTASIALGSPYVVDVFDFGELPDGRMWFAMELLDGHSLAKELGRDLDGERWAPERALGVLRQVCKGLGAAHDAGFIHRDVKPHNIMLVKRGSRTDHVKLVDFGVAAAIERGRDDEFLAGTPHYMAPEQAKGADYDQRLDIYGLGCVAYRMLTGRPPFLADSVMALLRMHREDMPAPPSSVPGCENIPKALDDAILKALAKDPDDRHPSMAEFEAALCEAQIAARIRTDWDHLPLPRVERDRMARLQRDMPKPRGTPAPRSRWLLPAAAALILATAGTVWAVVRSSETEEQRDQIDQLVADARAAGAKAFYVYPPTDDPAQPTAYRQVLELEAIDTKRARTTGEELRGEFAETLSRLGDFYWDKPGGRPFAADYYAQALLFDPEHPNAKARNVFTPGELATLRSAAMTGDFSETNLRAGEVLVALATPDEEQREDKLQEAMEKNESRASSTQEALAALMDDEAGSKEDGAKRKSRARPGARRGLDEAEAEDAVEVEAEDESDLDRDIDETATAPAPTGGKSKARSLASQGHQALGRGKREQAETLFHRALASNGSDAQALSGLCRVHYDRGQYATAVRYCRKAVAAAPRNASYRIRLGDAFYKEFQYPQAREQYLKAKELGSNQAAGRLQKVAGKIGN